MRNYQEYISLAVFMKSDFIIPLVGGFLYFVIPCEALSRGFILERFIGTSVPFFF